MNCGVCGKPVQGLIGLPYGGSVNSHPPHTDAELVETKQAVDLAARVLAAFVLIDMARRVVAA